MLHMRHGIDPVRFQSHKQCLRSIFDQPGRCHWSELCSIRPETSDLGKVSVTYCICKLTSERARSPCLQDHRRGSVFHWQRSCNIAQSKFGRVPDQKASSLCVSGFLRRDLLRSGRRIRKLRPIRRRCPRSRRLFESRLSCRQLLSMHRLAR